MDEFDFKKAIAECEPQAIETLRRMMRNTDQNALKAAEMVLAYAQGKPEQKVSGDVGLTVRIRHFMEDPVTGEVIEHISERSPNKPPARPPITTHAITTHAITEAKYTEQVVGTTNGTTKEF